MLLRERDGLRISIETSPTFFLKKKIHRVHLNSLSFQINIFLFLYNCYLYFFFCPNGTPMDSCIYGIPVSFTGTWQIYLCFYQGKTVKNKDLEEIYHFTDGMIKIEQSTNK